MKIISKPDNYVPWWVGRREICPRCTTRIELERRDDELSAWRPEIRYGDGAVRVAMQCPTCDELLEFYLNEKT